MKALIEAFTIFAKYIPDSEYPTICEHDEMIVLCDPELVSSEEDIARLEELGFSPACIEGENCFRSYRYGSA